MSHLLFYQETLILEKTILLDSCFRMEQPLHMASLHTIPTLWGRNKLLSGSWQEFDIHCPDFFFFFDSKFKMKMKILKICLFFLPSLPETKIRKGSWVGLFFKPFQGYSTWTILEMQLMQRKHLQTHLHTHLKPHSEQLCCVLFF